MAAVAAAIGEGLAIVVGIAAGYAEGLLGDVLSAGYPAVVIRG